MTTGIMYQVGATITVTKALSEADVALLTLVTNDQLPKADEPLPLDPMGRVQLPCTLIAAFMATAATRHAGGLLAPTIVRTEVNCTGRAWTGDTLTVSAQVMAFDVATRILQVQTACTDQDGNRLAEGRFALRTDD